MTGPLEEFYPVNNPAIICQLQWKCICSEIFFLQGSRVPGHQWNSVDTHWVNMTSDWRLRDLCCPSILTKQITRAIGQILMVPNEPSELRWGLTDVYSGFQNFKWQFEHTSPMSCLRGKPKYPPATPFRRHYVLTGYIFNYCVACSSQSQRCMKVTYHIPS